MAIDPETIEIHNAVPVFNESQGGWELPRYPRSVREAINTGARTVSGRSTGVEVRFVLDGPEFCLTVRTLGDPASLVVRNGAFWASRIEIGAGQTRRFLIRRPANFKGVRADVLHTGGWSPEVWRIQFDGADTLLQDIDGLGFMMRPPSGGEKPPLRWLAYGSSITNADVFGYPLVAAQLLPADVLNKGLSGSCHIEPEIADWFATLEFDFATLELGINMRGSFEPPEFEKRARYMVKRLRESHPQAPLILITHFLNRDHHPAGEPSPEGIRQAAYDDILRAIHKESGDPHLHLIEGKELLTDFGLLSADMIHPTHEGHAQMAKNLAARLKAIVNPPETPNPPQS